MSLNPQDDVHQFRFRTNLRWFLRNEAALKLGKEQGHLGACYILELFNEVSATFAEGPIDTFNAVVEHYQGVIRKEPLASQSSGLVWRHIVEVTKLPPGQHSDAR